MRAKREAAVAGACGALGGLCAKVALDAGPTAALVDSGVSAVLLRVLAGFAALAFNLHMTASQSRALDASPSSLQPTLIATASNFLLTVRAAADCPNNAKKLTPRTRSQKRALLATLPSARPRDCFGGLESRSLCSDWGLLPAETHRNF